MRRIILALSFLLFAYSGYCQVFSENFNRTNNTTVGNGWTETETTASGAQIISNSLQLGSTTAGREFVNRDVSALYTTNGITANTNSIVWAFNFKQTRAAPSGFDATNYGIAFILGTTSNTVTAGNGYAVVLGGSSPNAIRLTSFAGGPNLNSHFTDIISGGSFSNTFISVRVVYNAVTDAWSLYAESNASAFPQSNPLSTATQIGSTTVNTTYTAVGSDLKYMGAFWNHNTSAGETAIFDDISLAPTTTITSTLVDNVQDANSDTHANPGETIIYKNTITNTGTADAINAQLNNSTPTGTTLTANSLQTSALARDDNFSFNTTASTGNVLTNDFGLKNGVANLKVVSFGTTASNGTTTTAGSAGTTNAGGSLTVNADGNFTYTPPSAFTGTDKFAYVATTEVTGLANDKGVVTITVASDLAFTTATVDPSCNNGTNGSITITATGGNGGYQYSKDNGGSYQVSNVFSGLAAGTYNIVVKDAGNYTKSGTATLNNPAAIVVSGTIPQLTYNVAMTIVTFTKTGGTGSPANPWSALGLPTGVSINSANGNVTGTPTVTGSFTPTITYTDANGCTGTKSQTVLVGPNIVAETYTNVGNTQLVGGVTSPSTPSVSVSSLASNDQSDATITYAVVTGPTHGTLTTFNTNGTFLYTPTAGNTTSDVFTYSGTSNGVTTQATATINFNGLIWYVDNATGAGTNDGRSNTPFKTMTAVGSAATNNGDYIYVSKGSGSTTGAYTMKTSQQLIGAGATLSVGGALTVTGSAANTPTLSGTLTLASSVTVNGLDMSTTTSNAINATSITGVNVTPRNVTTTTGTAVNIGGSGNTGTYSFTSVSANGGANGISITNFTGTFTINGDGTNTTKGGNASGGTIQNMNGADGSTAGIGIYLNNTSNIVLRRMAINGTIQNQGIFGLSVTNFTMQYCTVAGTIGTTSGSNDLNLECPVQFGKTAPSTADGLFGTSTIDNCLISGGIQHNVEIYGQSGTHSLTISNSDITNNSTALGSDGIQAEMIGNVNSTISVQNCTLDNNKSQAIQVSSLATSTVDVTVNGCTIKKTTQGNEGVILQNGGSADLTIHFTSNTLTGFLGSMLVMGQVAGQGTSSADLVAFVKDNTFTQGSPVANRAVIFFPSSVQAPGNVPTSNVVFDNNSITSSGDSQPLFINTPDANTSPSYSVSVINNHVTLTSTTGFALRGIEMSATQGTTSTGAAACFDVRNNTVTYTNGKPSGISGIRVRMAVPGGGSANPAVNLEQGTSGSSDPDTVLAANNPAGNGTQIVGTVTVVNNNGCRTPPTF